MRFSSLHMITQAAIYLGIIFIEIMWKSVAKRQANNVLYVALNQLFWNKNILYLVV